MKPILEDIFKIVSIGLLAFFVAAVVFLAIKAITPESLTNEQIVEETQYCEDNGLEPRLTYNGLTGHVLAITCIPETTDE